MHERWPPLLQRLTHFFLRFLANENVPISSVKYLKAKGFDITSIGLEEAGISDEAVMHIAMKEGRTIITYDRDYGELIFNNGYKPSAGVIFIRQQPSEPLETAKTVERLASNALLSFERKLTVVDADAIRQKKY